MDKLKSSVQAIHYLLSVLGETDKLKIVKLLFFSDKLHLIKYGRTITGDSYIAMKNGPVGSITLNVLDNDMEYLSPGQLEYCDVFLEKVSKYTYRPKSIGTHYDSLSKSDMSTIEEVIAKFGQFDNWKLVDLTHKYPEWKTHEKNLLEEVVKCEDINLKDMFSSIPDDLLGIPEEIIDESKSIFLGLPCEYPT